MTEIFEITMIVLFGVSWPANVIKAYRARTSKGQSLLFLVLIFVGYVFGIASKLIATTFKWYVLFFYILNLIMVGAALILYFRNKRIDESDKKDN